MHPFDGCAADLLFVIGFGLAAWWRNRGVWLKWKYLPLLAAVVLLGLGCESESQMSIRCYERCNKQGYIIYEPGTSGSFLFRKCICQLPNTCTSAPLGAVIDAKR